MNIIGNIETANKFYIKTSTGGIEWVPHLDIAKRYVKNPDFIEWYRKTIYATSEEILTNRNGISYIASELPEDFNEKNKNELLDSFLLQAKQYRDYLLNEYAKKEGFNTIVEIISWKNSSIEELDTKAEKAFKYRDNIYKYHYNFISNIDITVDIDFAEVYREFIDNISKQGE